MKKLKTMKKLLFLITLCCFSTLSYSQELQGYLICGMQKINHPGGDNSNAVLEDYISMSDTPILLITVDNITDISVVIDFPGSEPETFNFKFYQSYKDNNTTFVSFNSTENTSQFTIETPESGIPRAFILAANEDYSLYFFNNCNEKDVIKYGRNNPDKIDNIKMIE